MKINERFPPELLQVLTHFYRGEVQRSTDWRLRLDTTTNWAIISMTAAFSWSFASREGAGENHIIFFFTSLVVFLLMCIEARRFRYFDVWSTRVRMLEVHLLMPSLHPDLDIVQGDWREVLSNDLLLPSFKISFLEALAQRLRANYIWIFFGLAIGWCLRIYVATAESVRGGDGLSLLELYRSCGYGDAIQPWAVVSGFIAFWCLLGGILLVTWRERRATGEIRRRDRKARQWPI